jgi:hypothetical protein
MPVSVFASGAAGTALAPKNKTFAPLFSLALALTVAACGQPGTAKPDPAPAPTPASTSETTTPPGGESSETEVSGRFNFGLPGEDDSASSTVTEGGYRFEVPTATPTLPVENNATPEATDPLAPKPTPAP